MKLIGKIVLLLIFVVVLFFYRNELLSVADQFSFRKKSTIEQASWGGLREEAFAAYDRDEPEVAVTTLEQYLVLVEQELRRHDYQSENELETTRLDVVCELNLIHNRLSNTYYRLSDTEKYFYHESLHRDFLSQCTEMEDDG
ncbi:MAG: hypothetical protein D6B25_03480 [Desulfobulbaceae bacterium]|nr:MAG: hypothetical protein D6B25_03480 [Desulfobulbaceae bacterium]